MISVGSSDAYVVRWTFLRAMAVVWLAAFVSLAVQIEGLAGPDGILPAGTWLAAVREGAGGAPITQVPTLCWWLGPGAGTLKAMSWAGAALAAMLAIGILPGLVSLLLWADYLSLAVACTTFLSFQWDALLLETGLVAVFLAPWKAWAPGLVAERPPSRTAVLLLRLLLFKLMFLSGVAKLTSGDPTWRNLTALQYHYWTTCLPVWTGWYVHQLPAWFHRASVALMFLVELAAPFLVFAPVRRLRIGAVIAMAALQVGIAATGNYGFFNLLTLALCIPALDDGALLACLPRRFRAGVRRPETHAWIAPWRQAPAIVFAAIVAPLSLVLIAGRIVGFRAIPAPAIRALQVVQPFRAVNAYGLFANMTTRRLEIIVEGSTDGETWKPYPFRWKPGDPMRRPEFVEPHMPRLDWQMWFAALSDWRSQDWFVLFLERVLQGSPPVLRLLAGDPFPDGAPRLIRATSWNYTFASPEEHRMTGAWWHRERVGPYCPVMELGPDGRIRVARVP